MTDEEYLDTYARHMADTELYAEARAKLAGDMLRKLNRELRRIIDSYGSIPSKARERECLAECDDAIRKCLDEWEEGERAEREEHAGREAGWLSALMAAAFGITLAATLAKRRRALDTPFNAKDGFDSFAQRLRPDIMRSVRTPLLNARIFGSATSAASGSLESSFVPLVRNAEADMRTSVTAVQRNVTYQLLADRRGLRLLYVSMLDGRVCAVCGSYSGNTYDDFPNAPAVPVHERCRCYYIPMPSGSGGEYGKESYRDWFARQPDSVKYRILGPTRYNFYKAGMTDMTRFTSDGRKLTLEELYAASDVKGVNTGARSEVVNKLSMSDIIRKEPKIKAGNFTSGGHEKAPRSSLS